MYDEVYNQIITSPVYLTVLCLVGIYQIVVMWKVFTKAGVAGWKSIIPIYNTYILTKITYGNGWLFLLLIVPIVGFVFSIMLYIKLAKAFGKGTGFGIGLWLLSLIFLSILAFDSSEYQGVQN